MSRSLSSAPPPSWLLLFYLFAFLLLEHSAAAIEADDDENGTRLAALHRWTLQQPDQLVAVDFGGSGAHAAPGTPGGSAAFLGAPRFGVTLGGRPGDELSVPAATIGTTLFGGGADGELTIAAWVRLPAFFQDRKPGNKGGGKIFHVSDGAETNYLWFGLYNHANGKVVVRDDARPSKPCAGFTSTSKCVDTSDKFSRLTASSLFGNCGGSFCHAAFTAKNGVFKMFLDGSLYSAVYSHFLPPSAGVEWSRAAIGAGHGVQHPFTGIILDLRLYTRALSAADMNAFAPPTTSEMGAGHWAVVGNPAFAKNGFEQNAIDRSGDKFPECLASDSRFSQQSNSRGNFIGVRCCCEDGSKGISPGNDEPNKEGCLEKATHADAVKKCDDEPPRDDCSSWRLCTKSEIQDEPYLGKGTGCRFDGYLLWTSSKCFPTGENILTGVAGASSSAGVANGDLAHWWKLEKLRPNPILDDTGSVGGLQGYLVGGAVYSGMAYGGVLLRGEAAALAIPAGSVGLAAGGDGISVAAWVHVHVPSAPAAGGDAAKVFYVADDSSAQANVLALGVKTSAEGAHDGVLFFKHGNNDDAARKLVAPGFFDVIACTKEAPFPEAGLPGNAPAAGGSHCLVVGTIPAAAGDGGGGQAMKLYLNSEPDVGAGTETVGAPQEPADAAPYFDGSVIDVRIFGYALSDSDVAGLVTAQTVLTGTLTVDHVGVSAFGSDGELDANVKGALEQSLTEALWEHSASDYNASVGFFVEITEVCLEAGCSYTCREPLIDFNVTQCAVAACTVGCPFATSSFCLPTRNRYKAKTVKFSDGGFEDEVIADGCEPMFLAVPHASNGDFEQQMADAQVHGWRSCVVRSSVPNWILPYGLSEGSVIICTNQENQYAINIPDPSSGSGVRYVALHPNAVLAQTVQGPLSTHNRYRIRFLARGGAKTQIYRDIVTYNIDVKILDSDNSELTGTHSVSLNPDSTDIGVNEFKEFSVSFAPETDVVGVSFVNALSIVNDDVVGVGDVFEFQLSHTYGMSDKEECTWDAGVDGCQITVWLDDIKRWEGFITCAQKRLYTTRIFPSESSDKSSESTEQIPIDGIWRELKIRADPRGNYRYDWCTLNNGRITSPRSRTNNFRDTLFDLCTLTPVSVVTGSTPALVGNGDEGSQFLCSDPKTLFMNPQWKRQVGLKWHGLPFSEGHFVEGRFINPELYIHIDNVRIEREKTSRWASPTEDAIRICKNTDDADNSNDAKFGEQRALLQGANARIQQMLYGLVIGRPYILHFAAAGVGNNQQVEITVDTVIYSEDGAALNEQEYERPSSVSRTESLLSNTFKKFTVQFTAHAPSAPEGTKVFGFQPGHLATPESWARCVDNSQCQIDGCEISVWIDGVIRWEGVIVPGKTYSRVELEIKTGTWRELKIRTDPRASYDYDWCYLLDPNIAGNDVCSLEQDVVVTTGSALYGDNTGGARFVCNEVSEGANVWQLYTHPQWKTADNDDFLAQPGYYVEGVFVNPEAPAWAQATVSFQASAGDVYLDQVWLENIANDEISMNEFDASCEITETVAGCCPDSDLVVLYRRVNEDGRYRISVKKTPTSDGTTETPAVEAVILDDPDVYPLHAKARCQSEKILVCSQVSSGKAPAQFYTDRDAPISTATDIDARCTVITWPPPDGNPSTPAADFVVPGAWLYNICAIDKLDTIAAENQQANSLLPSNVRGENGFLVLYSRAHPLSLINWALSNEEMDSPSCLGAIWTSEGWFNLDDMPCQCLPTTLTACSEGGETRTTYSARPGEDKRSAQGPPPASADDDAAAVPRVRLVGGQGSTARRGIVEILHGVEGGRWGTLCADGRYWDDNAAAAICRELGFAGGAAFAGASSSNNLPLHDFGRGKREIIWFAQINCRGSETSIFDCEDLGGWGFELGMGEPSCLRQDGFRNDAGVECDGNARRVKEMNTADSVKDIFRQKVNEYVERQKEQIRSLLSARLDSMRLEDQNSFRKKTTVERKRKLRSFGNKDECPKQETCVAADGDVNEGPFRPDRAGDSCKASTPGQKLLCCCNVSATFTSVIPLILDTILIF